jgi:hypothetical protein
MHAVRLARRHEAVEDRGAMAPGIAAAERPVVTSRHDRAECTLGDVVVGPDASQIPREEEDSMNLEEASSAHRQWKIRLRTFLNGGSQEQFDAANVAKDNQCDLGKWIHGAGAAHTSQPAFAALKSAHAQFHAEAAQVVKLATAGNKAGADRHLEGAFTEASLKVVQAIHKVKV